MDNIVDNIVNFIINEIKKTPLNREFDVSKIKTAVTVLLNDVILKLDKKDTGTIVSFIGNASLFQDCIIPNIQKILADGKLNLDDIPYFLEILYGIYTSIDQLIRENPTVTVSSNDIVELSGFILKASLAILVTNQTEVNAGVSIINTVIKFIKFNVKNVSKTCKLFCCCGTK